MVMFSSKRAAEWLSKVLKTGAPAENIRQKRLKRRVLQNLAPLTEALMEPPRHELGGVRIKEGRWRDQSVGATREDVRHGGQRRIGGRWQGG